MTQDPYEILKSYRGRKDLKLRKTRYLREEVVFQDGVSRPLVVRYYQVQGIMHLVAMKRFVLGDDTGLGKTLEAIAALTFLWEATPNLRVLVLTNKSAVTQWADEISRFTTGVGVYSSKGSPKKREKGRQGFLDHKEGPSILVMGYRSFVQDFRYFQEAEGWALVFDEATAFKNPSTQVHKMCAHLSKTASRVWALTATLIRNHLIDGWGIYRIVVPSLFGSKEAFYDEFCIVKLQVVGRRRIPMVVGYRKSAIPAFKERIDPYFLGRPKFEVAEELPPLTTRHVRVGMSAEQGAKYAEALSGLITVGELSGNPEEEEVTKLTALMRCQQIVDHPALIGCPGESEKLEALIDLLEGEFEGQKVIVYTRFATLVAILQEDFKKRKIKNVRIIGEDKDDARAKAQATFQNMDSGVNVIFITSAASEAVNLQSASVVVLFDSPWAPGELLQIIGRMIRLGSIHDRCYAIHLICEDSIDEKVTDSLTAKMAVLEGVIGKRIKGESVEMPSVPTTGDVNALFEALKRDAKKAASAKSLMRE